MQEQTIADYRLVMSTTISANFALKKCSLSHASDDKSLLNVLCDSVGDYKADS